MSRSPNESALQSAVLEGLSDARHYRRWLVGLAGPHLGDSPIEFGSGIGDYAAEWLPTVRQFTATEADEDRLLTLKRRFAAEPKVIVRSLRLPHDESGEHSGAVALNVLEHVADDVAGLRSMARMVRQGGRVALIVPAFPSAMSDFDRSIGHYRRYTIATMREGLIRADLDVEHVRYINPIGLINWYLAVKALRLTPHNGPLLRMFDRVVVPPSRWAERRFRPWFGQSVFAVARVR
jgi:SAM-dependent methyltransferase